MMTFIDQDPNIDYLYFLHWTNPSDTEDFHGMLEQPESNILVHSFRIMYLDGNWRH